MFKMTHPATEQTPAQTEYRYIGDNPNNYVYFNCDSLDNQSASTCEVWRIIGVFDVDDGTGHYEQRIKIVRGSALPDKMIWDDRNSETEATGNKGKNEWVGSVMQTYLNGTGEYYTRTGTAVSYGLKTTAKNMISDAKYYLGGTNETSENNGYGTADAIYIWERGTLTLNYKNYPIYCENNPTSEICTATRNTSWVGEVALMYPSDYALIYANGVDAVCYGEPHRCMSGASSNYVTPSANWIYNSNYLEGQNNIIYHWLLSPISNGGSSVFIILSTGGIYSGNGNDAYGSGAGGVRPVLYLSSNVKITDGTGQENNPYKLGL